METTETTEVKTETQSKACKVCGTSTKSGELAGLTFTSLEKNPFVCERCIARSLGIEAFYNETTAANLNEKV